jgi:hypothetical protein
MNDRFYETISFPNAHRFDERLQRRFLACNVKILACCATSYHFLPVLMLCRVQNASNSSGASSASGSGFNAEKFELRNAIDSRAVSPIPGMALQRYLKYGVRSAI